MFHENGIGKSSNFQKALECYNQAAETNYPAALNKLGQIYQRGNKHVKQDIAKGINYYEKAFELNDVDSAYNLGLLYETGGNGGVSKDLSKAFKYYLKGSQLGHKGASYKVALFLKKKNFNSAKHFTMYPLLSKSN